MKRNDRAIASFTSLGHGTFHGFELSIPLFIPIWLATMETSPTVIGIVVGAGYALIGLFAPVAGALSDAYGSKRLVLVSIGGMGLAFASLSAVRTVESLALVLLVWGCAASLYHPSGLSLISRGADRRGIVLAYHGAGGNVGMVAGPLATVGLLTVFEWRTVALLLALPAALCVAIGLGLSFDERGEPASRPGGEGARTGSRDGAFVLGGLATDARTLLYGGFLFVFAIQIVYGLYYRGIFTFLPDVLANVAALGALDARAGEIGAGQLAYSGLLLLGVFGQYLGGLISDRRSPELALIGTFVALTVASFLFVPASEAGAVPLLIVCATLGFFIYAFAPIAQTLVAEYVAEGTHGLSFGVIYLGMFGVGALGSAVAGVTLDYGGVAALFGVLSSFAVVCLGIATLLFVKRGELAEPGPAPR